MYQPTEDDIKLIESSTRRALSNEHDKNNVDDMVQESFVLIYQNLAKYRGGSRQFIAWGVVVAKQAIRNYRITERGHQEMIDEIKEKMS